MRNHKIDRSIRSACTMVMMLAVAAFADTSPSSGNPQTNASDKNYDTNQPNSAPGALQKSEDAANRGLNKVDNGVHKAVGKSKKGAHSAKKKTNEGLNKVDEKTHD